MKQHDDRHIILLSDAFRFIHEPVHYYHRTRQVNFVGREQELETFVQRILFSHGGSFLITGYRGVGKTSFVNHAIEQVKQRAQRDSVQLGPTRILDVYLNLARPMSSLELIYQIIRSLYQELERHSMLRRLDRHTREALQVAFERTSLSITRAHERGGEIGYDLNKLSANIPLSLPWTRAPASGVAQL